MLKRIDTVEQFESHPATREELIEDFKAKSGSRETQVFQLRYLETIIGSIALSNLLRMSSEIFTRMRKYQLLVEGNSVNSRTVIDEYRMRPNIKDYYLESQYDVLFDNWVIFVTVFELAPESLDYHETDNKPKFKKIVQIDFVFLDDYLDINSNSRKAYKHVKKGQALDGQGLVSSSVHFLKQLKQFVKSVDPSCLIRVYPSDAQRERIYKAALKDMPNVSIEFGKNGKSK